MEKKKKKSGIWGMILAFLCGGILGLALAAYMASVIPSGLGLSETYLRLGIMLLIFYASFLIQIILHELGHMIFGLISGYDFVSFRVGSFQLTRRGQKLHLDRHSVAGTAGQCLMSPPDLVDGRMPVLLYNLGGVIVNLLSAALFIPLYAILDSQSNVSFFCLSMALCGLLSALTNGIPMRSKNVHNDGYNALSLGKNKEAMRGLWLQLMINAELVNGKRLRDLPDEWFTVPSDDAMNNSMVTAVGVFACNRLLDQNRYKEVEPLAKHLLEIDSSMAGVHRYMLTLDRICCEILGKNRREVIDEMYTKELQGFMKSMKTSASVVRTQYIYALLVSCDPKEAACAMSQFEKIKKSYPYPGDIQSECEIMAAAQRKAAEGQVTRGETKQGLI